MPRRTKEEAQATRERLLEAAEQLFLAQGISRTTLGDIAQAAGTTRGAVYWHFADKTSVVQALFERVDLPMEQALQAAEQQAGDDPVERLRRLAREPFALMARDPRARAVFVILLHRAEFTGELDGLNARNDEAVSDCTQRMQRLFEQAASAGRLAPGVTPHAAAVALLALVDGLMRLATAARPLAVPLGKAGDEGNGGANARLPAITCTAAGLRRRGGATAIGAGGPTGGTGAAADLGAPGMGRRTQADADDPVGTAIDALLAGLTRPAVTRTVGGAVNGHGPGRAAARASAQRSAGDPVGPAAAPGLAPVAAAGADGLACGPQAASAGRPRRPRRA